MKNNELLKSKTYLNLAKTYAGECQAHVRYKFIEYGARMQGLGALAEVIDKIVYQEFNHARMVYSFIQTADTGIIDNIDIASGYPFKEKWDLTENLRLAAEDERFEAEKIYPEYEKTARAEGFDDIAGLYKNLIQVEKAHESVFSELYQQMKDDSLYNRPTAVKWKCVGCGFEVNAKSAPKECPLCQAKQGVFLLKLNSLM